MDIGTLTIVGVGLIGGSIGLAAKRRGVARRILGVERHPSCVAYALAKGAIDESSCNLTAAVLRAEVTVFCTPVDEIAQQVLAAASVCPADNLFIDTGSTKALITRTIESAAPTARFVGGHPLAGSEKQGVEHAEADLFENKLTIVTRTASTAPDALEQATRFWQLLGSSVRVMSPEEHDAALAFTSHLPHLLASALAGILPAPLNDLTASGFRDTTRIAAGDPGLWTAIFSHNRAAVLDALAVLSGRLECLRDCLSTSDWATLHDLLLQAKKVRDALGS
ncbi:MAG TPA: prephenate dehydrogenase/arogenate dehydrogenase family protein [Gemmataceae bacterium]|nr:prephenate dehydrogenase/arogenate dehydrogenase family protein [Gemmataceae bacterium]